MLSYIISEADFRSNFKIIDGSTAVKNGNKKSKKKSTKSEPESTTSESKPESTAAVGDPDTAVPDTAADPATPAQPTNTPERANTSMETSQFRKRKLFEKQVRQALQRYKIRSKL